MLVVRPELTELSTADRKIWELTTEYYSKKLANKDLLDEDLSSIKSVLARHENDAVLADNELPGQLLEALNQVAGIYRRTAWPAQDKMNRTWLSRHAAQIQRLGPPLSKELSAAFGVPWPKERVRLDLVPMAGGGGAYTSLGPLHIVLSTVDPRNQGVTGLEILFHEASHGLVQQLRTALKASSDHLAIQEPPNLWHAVLFYTVGELVKRHLPDYTPYAFSQGLWTRAWPNYIGPIQEQWKPYLDRKRSLIQASDALIQRVSSSAQVQHHD